MKQLKGNPLPLGISERDGIVNFSVAVEAGKKATLCIYGHGEESPRLQARLEEEEDSGKVRCVAFPKEEVDGLEYNYEIDGEVALDPYARGAMDTTSGPRGRISLDTYDWEGDTPLHIPDHDVIAYSLHVRGFTKAENSGVYGKGTFQGMIEKLPYLKDLGINQVQCMPIYAFCDNPKYRNYWGYGPGFYFTVNELYGADPDAEKELKDMVKAYHKSGIEVVLHLPFTEGTSQMLILDCLRYYVKEYHVDGFVLNPYVAPMECVLSDPILARTKILKHLDDFQNTMRQFLRGDAGLIPAVMWWLRQTTPESGSCNYITRHTGFTLMDLVSYNEKHNEQNGEQNQDGPDENYSWNCGAEGPTRRGGVLALRDRQRRNAMFLMMSAQGSPCILAGDEFGNSQSGNNNVYCQDNEVAWLDWDGLERDSLFYQYVKDLIALRKAYPVLHQAAILTGTDKHGVGVPDVSYHGACAWKVSERKTNKQLGIYYHGESNMDCYVAYNMHSKEQSFALPTLPKEKRWYQIFSTADEEVLLQESLVDCKKEIMIEGRTIAMFVGR